MNSAAEAKALFDEPTIRYTVGLSEDLIRVPDLSPRLDPLVKVTVAGRVAIGLLPGTWFLNTVKSVMG